MSLISEQFAKAASDHSQKQVLRYFVRTFLLLGVVLTGAITVIYNLETKDFLQQLKLREKHAVDVVKLIVAKEFSAVVADIQFLSRQNELHRYLSQNDSAAMQACAREYVALAESRGVYDQVRFIDVMGNELMRINYDHVSGRATIVPENKLQNKRGRYYFDSSLSLPEGEIFVSPFDLNVEHGAIEQPLKPMIRFGMPVFDHSGRKRGIVLLNYLGKNILNAIADADELINGKMLLVNSDGYWLRGLSSSDEWGFMYDSGSSHRFENVFSSEWQYILHHKNGQLVSDNGGLFTFLTVAPLADAFDHLTAKKNSIVDNYRWILLAHIPANMLYSRSGKLLIRLFVTAVFLFMLAAVPAWMVAQFLAQRKMKEMELLQMAHHDRLTGLPNRSLLNDRLQQVYQQSKRYRQSFAILYADLDGFKAVNDTYGHDVGDELLVIVAQRLEHVVRKADTVARVGGDEFIFVVTNIQYEEGPQVLARKVITEMGRPFNVKGHNVTIGISIGISRYPQHGDNIEELISRADGAMYVAKRNCKGSYRTVDDTMPGAEHS